MPKDLRENKRLIDFLGWYHSAQPYEKYVYHRGTHLKDNESAWKAKLLTFEYAAKGKVYLTTKRHKENDYSYIATKACTKVLKLIPSRDNDPRSYVRSTDSGEAIEKSRSCESNSIAVSCDARGTELFNG